MTPENDTPENDSPENDMSRRDELEALLPFYLNGTLDGQDLAAERLFLRGVGEDDAAGALALLRRGLDDDPVV